MKSPHRIIIALAIASSLSIVVLRSFAQPEPPATFDLTINGWQKLKQPYAEDGNAYENKILKHHTKKYCITHGQQSNGHQSHHCPRSHADASESEIIPVANPSSKGNGGRPAVNVTQKVSCATAADLQAVLDTFEK